MRPLSPTLGTVSLLLLLLAGSGCASRPSQPADAPLLRITIADTGWTDARPGDVHAVVSSAAEALLALVPRHRPLTIHVSNGHSGPKVFRNKNARGQYRVQLAVSGRYWAQLAYQFSHELCHVLSNFDARTARGASTRWFDEALCEAVSLHTLTRMAERWAYAPPFPNWTAYHGALEAYARRVLAMHEVSQPTDGGFGAWFAAHEPRLRTHPYERALTGVVAQRLYQVIAAHPHALAAITHLHPGSPPQGNGLPTLLAQWHARVPTEQQAFVRGIAEVLEIRIAVARGGPGMPPQENRGGP